MNGVMLVDNGSSELSLSGHLLYFFRELFKIALHTLDAKPLRVKDAAGLDECTKTSWTGSDLSAYDQTALTADTQTTLLQAVQYEPRISGCGSGLNGSRAMKASSRSLHMKRRYKQLAT